MISMEPKILADIIGRTRTLLNLHFSGPGEPLQDVCELHDAITRVEQDFNCELYGYHDWRQEITMTRTVKAGSNGEPVVWLRVRLRCRKCSTQQAIEFRITPGREDLSPLLALLNNPNTEAKQYV